MSVELRQLKDAVTGQPFVPVTHWDAVGNKPNIDGSLNSINASLNALDTSIKNIGIPIKSITGETGLTEYANSEFVAVSVSEPDENGNVNVDASVKAVTLANASNGHNGLAIAEDVYKELVDVEEVIATAQIQIANKIGLDSSLNLIWSEESGLSENITIKNAIENILSQISILNARIDSLQQ